jgi:integration host factor subunit beta
MIILKGSAAAAKDFENFVDIGGSISYKTLTIEITYEFTQTFTRDHQMVKSELIQQLSEQANIQPKIAEIAVNTVFDAMISALIKGEGIEIRGFGSFKVREYKGRTGNHPRTGSVITIEPKRRPFFKVGKELKDRINHHALNQVSRPQQEHPVETP